MKMDKYGKVVAKFVRMTLLVLTEAKKVIARVIRRSEYKRFNIFRMLKDLGK